MPLGRARGLWRATRAAALLLGLTTLSPAVNPAWAATLTIHTDELAGPPLMGLGVQWDPYDAFQPTQSDWDRTFRRLDYMRPGFIRVVEPAYDYFGGYTADHTPTYRWNSPHVSELLKILAYAQNRGIAIVLGDWGNSMLGGDPAIPAGFLQRLHDLGYTDLAYYNLVNEPNYVSGCDFGCWADEVRTLSNAFAARAMNTWLSLVGPDNANSWDDTSAAQTNDRNAGLDSDNPTGGDSWVTFTLNAVPGLIGAYDSHRYGTIAGVQSGVYQDQMYARREQISNLASAAKPYFEGELGLSARQVSPFTARNAREFRELAPLVDPSAQPHASTFVDSQPHIREFGYGVWMADMAVQALSAGLSGASAWDLDDAMHVGGRYGSQDLKQWGFWNSYGGQAGYPASDLRLRPWFYTWSVLARSFPAGSQPLITPSTGIPGLRVAAAKIPRPDGYGVSLAVVNDSSRPRSLGLAVPAATESLTLARYEYFSGERPVDPDGFPVPAAVLQAVKLADGVVVRLPSRGVVVLTSVGRRPISLADGSRALIDNLDSWRAVENRTGGLRLDHSSPARFNGDHSRAVSTAKHRPRYLVYHVGHITSFELKVYFHGTLGLGAMGSADGARWTPIRLASTHPAPAVGGHGWYLAELLPAAALAPQVNQLKLEFLNRRTELSQVIIKSLPRS